MANFICTTCGIQFADSPEPPDGCPICLDERQYLKPPGQQWTTMDQLRLTYRNSIRFQEDGLIGIGIDPQFAIGQRALLVQTSAGNVLWDCVPLLDPALVDLIRGIGGISAIAVSHPHYYSSMVQWSQAFGEVPIYLHAADREWVMRPDPAIHFWNGETKFIGEGLTLARCGGHFDGGTVLHWRAGNGGKGALLTGDLIQVVADRRFVSFMYSYPNFIPLPPASVKKIVGAVEPLAFDRIYGAFWDSVIVTDGKAAVQRSAERYLRAIKG